MTARALTLFAVIAIVFTACVAVASDGSDTVASTTTTTTLPPATSPPGVVVTDVSDLVGAVTPGVVTVSQTQIVLDMLRNPQEVPSGTGTGIVVDGRGHILTNFHVVQGATTVTVVGHDGRNRAAEVIGFLGQQDNSDLALLRVADFDGLQPIPLGDTSVLEVGDPVIAIGNALGLGLSVSVGIVSARGRPVRTDTASLQDMIQTDAAINPGNSGGPLLNAAGEVVGINTAVAGNADNIGFAIPVDQAAPFIEAVISGIGQPYIGIQMIEVTPQLAAQAGLPVDEGVAVLEVFGGSPAAVSGIRPGDLIVGIDGVLISAPQEVADAVRTAGIGTTVSLDVVRPAPGGPTRIDVPVTVGER